MVTQDRSAGAVRHRRARALLVALIAATGAVGAGVALAQDNAAGVDFTAVAGEQVSTPVATFTDFEAGAEEFAATIGWGDGTPNSAGAIVETGSCPYPDARCFEVRGTHTYSDPGTYPVEITISHGPDDPDPARVRATATVEPPPPGRPTARIELADSDVRPGEPAIVDASSSTGEIDSFAFDLNGNGTYETKSAFPYASVLRTLPGTRPIGVRVTGTNGTTSTAETTLVVTGPPLPPPPGQPQFEQGTTVGSPHPSLIEATAEAQLKAYNCPVTVEVGVAEATVVDVFPPKGEPCFKRKTKPDGSTGPTLQHPNYPQFVAGEREVILNGIEISTNPNPSAGNNPLVIFEKKKVVSQKYPGWQGVRLRLRKGGVGHLTSKQFSFGSWNVATPGTVGTFPIDDFFAPELLGMPVVAKDTPIKFTASQRSELEVFVLPPFFEFKFAPKNVPTGKPLIARADNTDGLEVEGTIIASGGKYELDLPLGIFHLTGTLFYSTEGGSHVWSGNIKLTLPSSPIQGINGFLKIRDGEFEQATVDLPFTKPGIPIGCCVYLLRIGGELTQSAIKADADFAAGPTLIGDLHAAEATAEVSWQFSPFLLTFKADQFRIAKWPVNATSHVAITNSFFLATAFWDDSFGPFSHKVNVEVRIGKPWYVAGGGSACFEVWIKGCAIVNAAAGPKGIGACGTVLKVLTGGVRVPWNPTSFSDWHGWWDCSFDLVKSKVTAAEAAATRARAAASGVTAAAAVHRLRMPRGLRGALLAIEGRGSQPQVEIRRPRGPRIVTPAEEEDVARGKGWLATRDTNDDTTYVVARKPAAGRWRVRALAGSPGIRTIGLARAHPRRFARGRVSGKGRGRILDYRVARRPGTKVTFVERGGPQSLDDAERVVEQTLGRARRAKGKIRFIPGEGRVRPRRIEALVSSQGTVIKTEVVDRFRAPKFRLPARPRVTVRRSGSALLVRWSRVPGARSYQAFVNRSDGETRYLTRPAGRRSARIGGIGGAASATVEIRAVSPAGYIGRPGFGRLRALPAVQLDRRQAIAAVLRAGAFGARCTAAGNGSCELEVKKGATRLAAGARNVGYGESRPVRMKLTSRGRKALRKAVRSGRVVKATVLGTVPGRGGTRARITVR